jgi:pantetheine-phosphate adenylyltransferase
VTASPTRRLVGLYPGTFDPVTRGHEDLIERALRIVDQLVVGVAVDTGKEPLFPIEERVAMLRKTTGQDGRVRVEAFSGLTVDFARSRGAAVVLRGLRAVSDFEHEFQMALMNKHLAPEIEILFMAPDSTYSFLSSSLVREVARLGGDVSPFVSPVVARRLAERFATESR